MIIPLIVEMEVLTDELLFPMEIEVQEPLYEMEVSTAIEVAGETPVYDGDYEFVPSEEQQTINIGGKMATDNIVIDPIPSNYGLITYDGVSILVS